MPASTDSGMIPGPMRWNIVGSRCPPVGEIAWPAGTRRGPSTHPRSMARESATSISTPPVRTNNPRLRAVVKPASSVLRALRVVRSVRNATSSCTSLRGLPPDGPPSARLSSMSMRPGSSVTSPSSISLAAAGTASGFTAVMRSPSMTTTTGDATAPLSMSSQRSARTTTRSDMAVILPPATAVRTHRRARDQAARRGC